MLYENFFESVDTDSAHIEALIKVVEKDGLSHSMAMGELLRALHSLSQTLSDHQTAPKRTAPPDDASA